MNKSAERKALFGRLKVALEEGIEFAKGNLSLRTIVVVERPPEVTAEDIRRIRQRVGMSQQVFARTLNVSTKTIQSWEKGHRRPSQAALRLLQLLNQNQQLFCIPAGVADRLMSNVNHAKRNARHTPSKSTGRAKRREARVS